jgi:hypothetical protein
MRTRTRHDSCKANIRHSTRCLLRRLVGAKKDYHTEAVIRYPLFSERFSTGRASFVRAARRGRSSQAPTRRQTASPKLRLKLAELGAWPCSAGRAVPEPWNTPSPIPSWDWNHQTCRESQLSPIPANGRTWHWSAPSTAPEPAPATSPIPSWD